MKCVLPGWPLLAYASIPARIQFQHNGGLWLGTVDQRGDVLARTETCAFFAPVIAANSVATGIRALLEPVYIVHTEFQRSDMQAPDLTGDKGGGEQNAAEMDDSPEKGWPGNQEDSRRPCHQQWNLCSFKYKSVHVAPPEGRIEKAHWQIAESQDKRSRNEGAKKKKHTDNCRQIQAEQTNKCQIVVPGMDLVRMILRRAAHTRIKRRRRREPRP